MLRIDQIRLLPGDSEALLPGKCARILRLPAEDIVSPLGRLLYIQLCGLGICI